jgi:predicted MFS family arabinose efflux permease
MFVVGTDLFVLAPLLPLIGDNYEISPALAGLGVAVFALTYMISAPLLGCIADRIGRRRMLTCCLFAFAAANLLTASATNFSWLLATRLFAGAATAGVSPSVYALVSGVATNDRRATWLALVASGLLVSLALGAPIGGLAGACVGWRSIFAALAVFSLVFGWVNSRIWPEDRPVGNIPAVPAAPTIAVLGPRLAPMVAWSTALYGVYTFLGSGLALYSFSTAQIAEVIFAYGCGALGGILIGGRAADQLGVKLTSAVGLGGLSVCLLLVRLALDAGIHIGVAFGLLSAVAQLFFPSQQAGLVDDFPARRATVLAWNNSALFFGISLGSLVGGQAILLGGFSANLTISAVIALVAWGMNHAVTPSPARPQPRPPGPTKNRTAFELRQAAAATAAGLGSKKESPSCPIRYAS